MLYPKIGLSCRKKLPVLWFLGENFYLHDIFQLMRKGRNWTMLDHRSNQMVMKHKSGYIFHSDPEYVRKMIHEWNEWEKAYTMPFPLKGKTVLDVGAGCGETALFFFLKGAEKVICIEKDQSLRPFLEKNKEANNWNLAIIIEPFNLKHLDLRFDAAKMDIEGAEAELLKLKEITFPLCVETHSKCLEEQFSQLGFKVAWRMKPEVAVMHNW